MELASILADEPFSDNPASVCPLVAAFLRSYNDHVDDQRRRDRFPYAAAAVGTAHGPARARAQRSACTGQERPVLRRRCACACCIACWPARAPTSMACTRPARLRSIQLRTASPAGCSTS